MENLVELYQGNEARVGTWKCFKSFGYSEHRNFKVLIDKNMDSFLTYGEVFEAFQNDLNKRKKGGQEKSYMLNEEQFMLLIAVSKSTKESIGLKMRVIDEFFRMRKQLAQMASVKSSEEWQDKRLDGKAVYKQKTDVIKQFVDYCIAAGSKSADKYYTSLAVMENKALFIIEQKYPNVREFLNVKQLGQVMVSDQIIEKAMLEEMDKGTEYHEIFKICKDRVIRFSEILGKSMVVEMLENQPKKLQTTHNRK
jgi:phage regulator Rha-like protein